MKKELILMFLLFIPIANSQIPLLEFNFTKDPGGIFQHLPRSVLIPKNQLFSSENDSIILHIDKLVELPNSGYVLSTNSLENIHVIIKDNDIILTPEPGWFGQEKIVVFIDTQAGDILQEIQLFNQRNSLVEEINLETLERAVFDQILFNMFDSELKKIINERSNIVKDEPIKVNFNPNDLVVNVGENVLIKTSFEDTGQSKDKPKIDIKVIAGILEVSPAITHCTDNIKNYGELDVDCGGNCKPCQESFIELNTLITILFSIIFLIVIYYYRWNIIYFTQNLLHPEEKEKRINIKQETIKVLENLMKESKNLNPSELLSKLNQIINNYFIHTLSEKKVFTYEEIIRELDTRKIRKKIKDDMKILLNTLIKINYSGYALKKDEVKILTEQFRSLITNLPSRFIK